MSTTWDEAEDEAAALWVSRHLGGMIDATAFSAWLAGAPGRKRRFDALWASCMDTAVTDALEDIDEREPAPSTMPRRIAMAAGAVMMMMLAIFFAWPTLNFALTPAQDYATRAGEIRRIALADGSHVTLGGNSRMRVKLAGDRREVALQDGEAYFDIMHDAERPFSVRAGQGKAVVLGTRFDIALADARVELAVEQGLVSFGDESGDAEPMLVKAGYRTALQSGRLEALSSIGQNAVAGWRDGWMEADDIPLWRLIAELRRWSSKPIEIRDAALREKRIAGRFRLSDPRRQLENLAMLHGFRVRDSSAGFVITMQ